MLEVDTHSWKSYSITSRIREGQTAKHMVKKLPFLCSHSYPAWFSKRLSLISSLLLWLVPLLCSGPTRQLVFLGVTFRQHIAFQLFKLKRNRLCLSTPVLKQPRYHSGFDGSKLSRVGQELESPPFASSKPEMGRLSPVRQQGSGRSTAADFTATNVTPDHQSWTLVSIKAEFSCCNDHIETWPKKQK